MSRGMSDDTRSTRHTSTSIPRFELEDASGRQWTLQALSSPNQAARFFRIALELGAATPDDVRDWARAYTKVKEWVPRWVWDVLDPDISVERALRGQDPTDLAGTDVRTELIMLEAGLSAGTITSERALAHLHQRKWGGDLQWFDAANVQTALSLEAEALADAWAREKLHREVERGKASDAWPALDEQLRAFLARYRSRTT